MMFFAKYKRLFARTLASGVIAGSIFFFQNFNFFSIINLTEKIFESVSKRTYPLKTTSIILENSAVFSLFKKLVKR